MQRLPIPNPAISMLIFADGLVFIFIAIFAFTLGMDPNPDWGRSRIFSFSLGILLIGISLVLSRQKPAFTRSETTKIVVLMGHIWAVIFIIYAWFITFGTFTSWKASTQYYTLLADAFGKGQLHVDLEPNATLLEQEDPYDPNSNRAIDDEMWDMSFYEQKFYLYWGPIPAVLLIPFQGIAHRPIPDIYLVYFFACGLLVFNSLILIKLWRLYFREIHAWHLTLSIFLIGLILPVLWSLNIPDVYEAAIGAGQFFLIGGIYFTICAFEKKLQKRYLFLAGFFFACSVGSRAMNALPLVLLIPWIMYWIFKHAPGSTAWRPYLYTLSALLIPLALGAFTIGWYNTARFDSPFEFGLRYQLTIHNLNKIMPQTFQPDYLLPNLFAYVFQPFTFTNSFPFLLPETTQSFFERFGLTPPMIYFGGRMVGLLVYAPFLIFALIPFFFKRNPSNNSHYDFAITLFEIAFIVNLIGLLFFFFAQMRYSVDIISQITLLAILGYWRLAQYRSQTNTWKSKALVFIANLLLIITITVSFLLSFSSESDRMKNMNPIIMERIESFFKPPAK